MLLIHELKMISDKLLLYKRNKILYDVIGKYCTANGHFLITALCVEFLLLK